MRRDTLHKLYVTATVAKSQSQRVSGLTVREFVTSEELVRQRGLPEVNHQLYFGLQAHETLLHA
jgi:hypothetical protein